MRNSVKCNHTEIAHEFSKMSVKSSLENYILFIKTKIQNKPLDALKSKIGM